ncbi:ankyrin repeat and SOCS box protein 3 [Aspergillus awamori]|uniref:Ankyrin repeat and SOCS box protein 3 n=1 Tax=Aspergillus awamori TaxID=105351 RepID=A0A401KXY9_ASPAW|nr:ankyrin repeat and SOCS box protein 3 [Aspergillus awamori]GKZ52219.1 hypothetical protein AnigIFM49718_000092 [Aspergillus niger]
MPCTPSPFKAPVPNSSPALEAVAEKLRASGSRRLLTPEGIGALSTSTKNIIDNLYINVRKNCWADAICETPAGLRSGRMDPTGRWHLRNPHVAAFIDDLSHAIQLGDISDVDYYLSRRIPLNTCDREGNSLLHLALVSGHLDIARLLLDRGASPLYSFDPEVPELDQLFQCPNRVAPQLSSIRVDILRLLLRYGAPIRRFPTLNVLFDSPGYANELLGLLLDRHPDILHERSKSGHTILHSAAAFGTPEACELLLTRAPHLRTTHTDWDVTPLHMAILEKNELTACFLISADMTLQMRHGYDRTELFLAACMGLRRVVKLLLSSTAFFAYPPQKWVSDAKAAVRVALYMGNTEVVDMIRRDLGLSWHSCLSQFLTRPRPVLTPASIRGIETRRSRSRRARSVRSNATHQQQCSVEAGSSAASQSGNVNVPAPSHPVATVTNSGTDNLMDSDEGAVDAMSLDAQVDRFLQSVGGNECGKLGVMDTVMESIEES